MNHFLSLSAEISSYKKYVSPEVICSNAFINRIKALTRENTIIPHVALNHLTFSHFHTAWMAVNHLQNMALSPTNHSLICTREHPVKLVCCWTAVLLVQLLPCFSYMCMLICSYLLLSALSHVWFCMYVLSVVVLHVLVLLLVYLISSNANS